MFYTENWPFGIQEYILLNVKCFTSHAAEKPAATVDYTCPEVWGHIFEIGAVCHSLFCLIVCSSRVGWWWEDDDAVVVVVRTFRNVFHVGGLRFHFVSDKDFFLLLLSLK